MANIKQQKKRIGIAQRQRLENLRYRSTIKTLFRALQLHVDTGDKEAAATAHRELVRLLDRATTRGALHRNTASRKKARAARLLLQEPKSDTATVRRAKKKATPARKPKAEGAAKKDTAAKKDAAAKKAPAKSAAKTVAKPAKDAEATADEATTTDEATATDAEATATDAPEAAATQAPADDATADDAKADEA